MFFFNVYFNCLFCLIHMTCSVLIHPVIVLLIHDNFCIIVIHIWLYALSVCLLVFLWNIRRRSVLLVHPFIVSLCYGTFLCSCLYFMANELCLYAFLCFFATYFFCFYSDWNYNKMLQLTAIPLFKQVYVLFLLVLFTHHCQYHGSWLSYKWEVKLANRPGLIHIFLH